MPANWRGIIIIDYIREVTKTILPILSLYDLLSLEMDVQKNNTHDL